jgi:hypothetical protein
MYNLSCPFCPQFIIETHNPTIELKEIIGGHLARKHRTEMETYFWLASKVAAYDDEEGEQ